MINWARPCSANVDSPRPNFLPGVLSCNVLFRCILVFVYKVTTARSVTPQRSAENLPVTTITILRHVGSNGCHLLAMNSRWNQIQRSYLQAFGRHLLCFLPLVDEETLMNCAKSGQIVPALGKGTDIEDRRGPSGQTTLAIISGMHPLDRHWGLSRTRMVQERTWCRWWQPHLGSLALSLIASSMAYPRKHYEPGWDVCVLFQSCQNLILIHN